MAVSCVTTETNHHEIFDISVYDKKITFSDKMLSKSIPLSTIIIPRHPAYSNTKKEYSGYLLKNIIKHYFMGNKIPTSSCVYVSTLDGWRAPVYKLTELLSRNALVAVKEINMNKISKTSKNKKWSLAKIGEVFLSPGPFYLVWNLGAKLQDIMPMQVKQIFISKCH